eukprot:644465-Pelagomonas_calceolata.AAC.1
MYLERDAQQLEEALHCGPVRLHDIPGAFAREHLHGLQAALDLGPDSHGSVVHADLYAARWKRDGAQSMKPWLAC